MEWGWTWSGMLSFVLGVATGLLALGIFRAQKRDHNAWAAPDSAWKKETGRSVDALDGVVRGIDTAVESLQAGVEDLQERLRELAEQQAQGELLQIDAQAEDEPSDEDLSTPDRPKNVTEYLKALEARQVFLDPSKAHWEKRIGAGGLRTGNRGWFVDDGGAERWFIHKARSTVVRPAIPQKLLRAWEEHSGRSRSEVEIDYRTGSGKGNHSWFVKTFDDLSWRISQGAGELKVQLWEEDGVPA